MKSRRTLEISSLFIAMFLVLACGGDREQATNNGTDTSLLGADTRPPVAVAETGHSVVVTIEDNAIGMLDTHPPGPTVFTVTNAGQKPHNFVVERDLLDWRLDQDLQPGETGSVQVDLQAGGTYRAYCPLEGHAEQMTFTVRR